MNSAFYDCRVMHQRFAPKRHRLDHAVFMFYLDLAELDAVSQQLKWFGVNRPALYAFYDKDHLESEPGATGTNAIDFMQSQGLLPNGAAQVHLLTHPRMLGHVFNPISIFYFFDEDAQPLAALAEVGNTFGEQKTFALPYNSERRRFELQTRKDFYVSPFSDVEDDFDFRISLPEETTLWAIDTLRNGEKTLISSLKGRRLDLSIHHMLALTARYPFVTLKVIFLIHWHAFLLWLKRTRFYLKESKASRQTEVRRPHKSLRKNEKKETSRSHAP